MLRQRSPKVDSIVKFLWSEFRNLVHLRCSNISVKRPAHRIVFLNVIVNCQLTTGRVRRDVFKSVDLLRIDNAMPIRAKINSMVMVLNLGPMGLVIKVNMIWVRKQVLVNFSGQMARHMLEIL